MITARSPKTLLREQLGVLSAHVPGLRDAVPDSVHEARVATRRIRELLGLLPQGGARPEDDVMDDVRRMGKKLGRVRELDVMRLRLDRAEALFPATALAVASARRGLTPKLRSERRRMVESLEHVDLPRLIQRTNRRGADLGGRLTILPWTRAWTVELRRRIAAHADRVAESVEHGSGVYFSDRAHSTRISIKKLRYSVEIADATGVWRPANLLKDVKRIQSLLGDAHDIQVLLDHLQELTVDTSVAPGEIRALEEVLEAEVAERHRRYLAQRERLKAICLACAGRRAARRSA